MLSHGAGRRGPLIGVAASSLVLALSTGGRGLAQNTTATQAAEVIRADATDRVDLALTIYTSNVALVRDVRQLRLPPGPVELVFGDVPATIDPSAVRLRSLTAPRLVRILEQTYAHDRIDQRTLLERHIGREVTLVRQRQDAGTTVTDEIPARLLALDNEPVWQIGDDIIAGLPVDHIRFPGLPDDLHLRPTVVWTLDHDGDATHRLEAAYLAADLTWTADYAIALTEDDSQATMDGWITLTNRSGTTFPDAAVQVVAGDLNRLAPDAPQPRFQAARAVAQAEFAADVAEESVSEYHLYTLGRRTTVGQDDTKQVRLLDPTAVPVRRRFVVDGRPLGYRPPPRPGAPALDPVRLWLRFTNTEDDGLGLPLPAGAVRVFGADGAGRLQLLGEDRLRHTPTGETVDIEVGTAFDVVAERRQTEVQRLNELTREIALEITLRNRRDAAIVVEINDVIDGDWEMISASADWTAVDAATVRFDIPAPPRGEAVVRYRVRTRR